MRAKLDNLSLAEKKTIYGFVFQDPTLVLQGLPLWSIFLEKHLVALEAALPSVKGELSVLTELPQDSCFL